MARLIPLAVSAPGVGSRAAAAVVAAAATVVGADAEGERHRDRHGGVSIRGRIGTKFWLKDGSSFKAHA